VTLMFERSLGRWPLDRRRAGGGRDNGEKEKGEENHGRLLLLEWCDTIRPAHGAAMRRWAGLDHGQRGEIGFDGVGVDGMVGIELSGAHARMVLDVGVGMRRPVSGARGMLGVQRPLIGGPVQRERSLTSGPLSILFHNKIKSPEIELTAGK
jgi:hypothetical protein